VRLATLVITLTVVLAAGCGGSDDAAAPDATETMTPVGSADGGSASCTQVEFPEPQAPEHGEAPSALLDADTTYSLTFTTNCGSFTVTLDQKSAPRATASLVALAGDGYYDDTLFHRIVPGFVIQGGDPTQTGTGGPGYSTVDAPKADARYTKGVVAMAKTQDEPAGTAGSQFFVVTGDDVGLPPEYAVVGTVTEGMDVVERIGALGDPATEQPLQPVVIHSVTAASSP
jgi:peptidyl-prolyl cis-trans isomerase B (cyclophilin B)